MREHKDERKVDLSCAPIDHTQFVRVYPRPQPRYARFPAVPVHRGAHEHGVER
ncbi:hypothetical protein DDE82_000451 [Stemphylium lycopersici]|nr:hypothetical protein TW65_07611 [Stemphylium lycopersici]RAR12108.1 hypothetical protein DDE82_000451 [Stemphylium lycopersici]